VDRGCTVGSLVHHGPVAGVSGDLAGVAPGGRFRGIFFTVSGGEGGEAFGILTGGRLGGATMVVP
jgi:hypothetical protein